MAEDLQATGPVEVDESPQRRRVWRGPWRSVVLPIVVVGVIAGAIWWLDYRPESGSSPYDARYGPVEMPAGLVPPGMAVEAKKGSLAPDFLLAKLDGGEGAVSGNAFGTYLHGSLLPKNPRFADHLIEAALLLRHKGFELAPLDDRVEEAAHAAAVRLATRRGIISV